jgi:hypothetical protein
MPKHLNAIVKECRYLLEKDFADQCHKKRIPGSGNKTIESKNSVKEIALAFLMELAVIRCFEERRWKIPSWLSFSSTPERVLERLLSSYKTLRSEICFSLNKSVLSGITLSIPTLKAVLHHFTETISPDEWRSENILGWIYQSFYDNTSEQKQHGKFYTPEPIAEYIVFQVFDMFLSEQRVKDKGQKAVSPLASNPLPLAPEPFTLLDIGCGSGVFALQAFDRLYKIYTSGHHPFGFIIDDCRLMIDSFQHPTSSIQHQGSARLSVPQQILENHLFLVDNDPWACQIAAINLYLKAKSIEPDCHIRKMNVFCVDALQRWEKFSPSPNPSHKGRGKTPHWLKGQEEKDRIRKLFTRKYNLIVGNPPYTVVNQLRTPKELIQRYKSYRSAAFKINTFALFIERGIELLEPSGLLGMIIPNTLLTQVYFEPLRKYILSTSKILRILDTKRMFDNAFVENCILLLQREATASERAKNVVDCVVNISNGERKNSHLTTVASGLLQSAIQIPQHHFEKAPFNMFNVRVDERIFVLMEKIASENPKLGEICESHDGVNPGNAKHKLIVSKKLDEMCKKVLNGKNIGRYWLKWGGLYVRYNRNLLTKGDNVRWGHRLSLDSAKILTRQTADRIIGTFDNSEYYTTNSVHTTILKNGVKEFHLKYLLALLNSKLISFYYRKLFPENGQVFSQVKLINLRQLPLKQIPMEDQNPFIAEVDTLLQEKKFFEEAAHNNNCNTPSHRRVSPKSKEKRFLDYLAEVEMRLYRLKEKDDRLDQKIYELYQLSPDEIQMIEDELGRGVCLCPKVPVDDLRREISFETFQNQYCGNSQTIFHMAARYGVHPESIIELRKEYKIFHRKDLRSYLKSFLKG